MDQSGKQIIVHNDHLAFHKQGTRVTKAIWKGITITEDDYATLVKIKNEFRQNIGYIRPENRPLTSAERTFFKCVVQDDGLDRFSKRAVESCLEKNNMSHIGEE